MAWSKRIRRAVAASLVLALVAVGAISATHAHDETRGAGHGCVACRVVHSAALAPVAPTPLPIVAVVEAIEVPHCSLRAAPRVHGAAPRGPPAFSA